MELLSELSNFQPFPFPTPPTLHGKLTDVDMLASMQCSAYTYEVNHFLSEIYKNRTKLRVDDDGKSNSSLLSLSSLFPPLKPTFQLLLPLAGKARSLTLSKQLLLLSFPSNGWRLCAMAMKGRDLETGTLHYY